MNPTSPIDPVLRLARTHEKPEPYEIEVLIGSEGKVRDGLLARWRAERRYLVRVDHDFHLVSREVSIRDFETGQIARIPYRCRGKVREGCAVDAVEGLYDRTKSVIAKLEERIQAAVTEWWEAHGRAERHAPSIVAFRRRADIQDAVISALAKHGLRVEMVLLIDSEAERPINLAPFAFKVRLRDYLEAEQSLQIDVLRLVPVAGAKTGSAVLPEADADRKEIIKKICRDAAEKRVTLHMYGREPRKLATLLQEAVNAGIRALGWACDLLVVQTSKPALPGHRYIDVQYTWPSLDGQLVPFKVRLETFIEVDGDALYAQENRPDLEVWFKRALEDETQSLLLQHELTALMPSYAETLQLALEEGIQRRAKKIGIGVRALVMMSKLAEWQYLQNFLVEVEKGSYSTSASDSHVHLDMSIHGSFNNREQLKDLLSGDAARNPTARGLISPQDKVREKIGDWAREAVGFVMRTTSLGEYLNHFEQGPRREDGTFAPSVHARIEARIKSELKERLKFQVSSVSVLQQDAELIEFVRSFQGAGNLTMRGLIGRPVDRASLSDEYKVDITLAMNGVLLDKIEMLKRKKTTPESIWEMVSSWIPAALNSAPRLEFLEFTAAPDDKLLKRIDKALAARAMDVYGADIFIAHLWVDTQDLRIIDSPTALQHEAKLLDRRLMHKELHAEAQIREADIDHRIAMATIQRDGREQQAKAIEEEKRNAITTARGEWFPPAEKTLEQLGNELAASAEGTASRPRLSLPGQAAPAPPKAEPQPDKRLDPELL